jgi:hypothetical protein
MQSRSIDQRKVGQLQICELWQVMMNSGSKQSSGASVDEWQVNVLSSKCDESNELPLNASGAGDPFWFRQIWHIDKHLQLRW